MALLSGFAGVYTEVNSQISYISKMYISGWLWNCVYLFIFVLKNHHLMLLIGNELWRVDFSWKLFLGPVDAGLLLLPFYIFLICALGTC